MGVMVSKTCCRGPRRGEEGSEVTSAVTPYRVERAEEHRQLEEASPDREDAGLGTCMTGGT